MKYSLSDYKVSITVPQELSDIVGRKLVIGGEGSFIGSITVEQPNELFSVKNDATGGYVHSKNLAANGTISISLNQMSPAIARFKRLYNFYRQNDYDYLTINVLDRQNQNVATAEGCLPLRIPAQVFANESQEQSWQFTCGKIIFE